MKLTVRNSAYNYDEHGSWYISDGHSNHLWKDLTIKSTTWCSTSRSWMGYYATKAGAERYLMAYRVKNMKFIVRQSGVHLGRGWYIRALKDDRYAAWFVGPTLELLIGPKYYHTEDYAKMILRQFKEKYNMAENKMVISVKVNGVDTPLHEISEETLLKIREASKPKPVPVFQVADCSYDGKKRLIIKLPKDMSLGQYSDGYISFKVKSDGTVGIAADDSDVERMKRACDYKNIRELKLDEV